MYTRRIGRLIIIYLILSWALAACQAREGGDPTPVAQGPTVTVKAAVLPDSAIARTPLIPFSTAEPPYPGPAQIKPDPSPTKVSMPYPGPPTEPPDVPPRTPLPTPTIPPTRTPRPAKTPTAIPTATEIPADYLLPTYHVEQFEPPELLLAALWTTDHQVVTAHSDPETTFELAPKSWNHLDSEATLIQVTEDGSKIAYSAWVSRDVDSPFAGKLIIIDDLPSGERHIYQFPYVDGPGFEIPDLHFSPDERALLFVVNRGLSWAWMTIDLLDWSIRPLPLNLDSLADPNLGQISGQPSGLRPDHSTYASLFPTAWTPTGIIAQKVLVGSDATPFGVYLVDPVTGAVELAAVYSGWAPYATSDGNLIVFFTIDISPFEINPNVPFTSSAFHLDVPSREYDLLFLIEDRQIFFRTWTPNEKGLVYSIVSPDEWKTEGLGLFDLVTGQHQTIDLSEYPAPELDFAGIQPLDQQHFLLQTYSREANQTSLYTIPVEKFSLDHLNKIQTLAGQPTIIFIPGP